MASSCFPDTNPGVKPVGAVGTFGLHFDAHFMYFAAHTFGLAVDLVMPKPLAHEAPLCFWHKRPKFVGAPVTQIKGSGWGPLEGDPDLPGWRLLFGHARSFHHLRVRHDHLYILP